MIPFPIPDWARKALTYGAVALFVIGLGAALKGCYDRSVTDAYETKVQAGVATATASAEATARAEASSARTKTETTNENVRQAAARSDDPLRAGLEQLRRESAGRQPSGRPH